MSDKFKTCLFAMLMATLLFGTACSNQKKTDSQSTDGANGTGGESTSLADAQPSNKSTAPTKQASSSNSKPADPMLKIQVVKGEDEGALDFVVANNSQERITNCSVRYFDGDWIALAKIMKPGQVAICGISGETPKSITFKSDQFDEYVFELPEKPQGEIDISGLELADLNIDDAVATGEPKKEPKKPRPKRDLMDFGDDDSDKR